jgi:hypothetical protein
MRLKVAKAIGLRIALDSLKDAVFMGKQGSAA